MTSGGSGGPGGSGDGPGEGPGPTRAPEASVVEGEASSSSTAGSGTRPEGHTRRDPPAKRPGDSSPTGDPLIGRILLERYRVLRRVGVGGMGSVYAGEQIAVGREVALKVLRGDLLSNEHVRQRFRREAEVIGRLSHPNTIQLIDYGETEDGLAVMVTELLRGVPLNDRLADQGPMDLIEVLELGQGVAESLAEAHARGLVHRDLKPANIFLVDLGDRTLPKVLDFGIARLLDEEATRLTSAGQVFGTPRYMSPEQALSTADVDARSDLYSLGLILYEGLVGQPPFVAQTSLQYLSAHTQQTPPKLRARFPAAPVALEALIDACLEKEPDRRPQSARALADQLGRIRRQLEDRTGAPREAGATLTGISDSTESGDPYTGAPVVATEVRRGGRSGRLLVVGLVAAVVALVAGGVASIDRNEVVDLGQVDGGARELAALVPPLGEGTDGAPEAPTGSGLDAAASAAAADPSLEDASVEDASVEDAGVDAPSTEAPEVVPTNEVPDDPPPRQRTRPRARPDAGAGPVKAPPVGVGATTGPRGLILETPGEAEEPDLVQLASGCRRSKWRGRSRLTVTGCADGCAILVDELCAGATPATNRAVAPGRRDVAVVCRGRVVRAATLVFEDQQTTTFSCR